MLSMIPVNNETIDRIPTIRAFLVQIWGFSNDLGLHIKVQKHDLDYGGLI